MFLIPQTSTGINGGRRPSYGRKYLRTDQVKFVEDSLQKNLKRSSKLLKAVFHKFY